MKQSSTLNGRKERKEKRVMSAGRKGGGLALALSHFLLLPFPCPPPNPLHISYRQISRTAGFESTNASVGMEKREGRPE